MIRNCAVKFIENSENLRLRHTDIRVRLKNRPLQILDVSLMKRFVVSSTLTLMILLATIATQPAYACAKVIGSGSTSGTATASTSDVPKGAKVTV